VTRTANSLDYFGSTVGRPPPTARPEFAERWAALLAAVKAGTITHAAAARRLGIGHATLLRLLATPPPLMALSTLEGRAGRMDDLGRSDRFIAAVLR